MKKILAVLLALFPLAVSGAIPGVPPQALRQAYTTNTPTVVTNIVRNVATNAASHASKLTPGGTLSPLNAANLTNLNASSLASGTVPEARSAHTLTNATIKGLTLPNASGDDDLTVTVTAPGGTPTATIASGSAPGLATVAADFFVGDGSQLTGITVGSGTFNSFIDVKRDYGAMADGSDDTSEIQSALNQGGLIVFPNGTYNINPLTGLRPVSHSRIILSPKAIITSTNNLSSNSARYWFLDAVEDVIVEGGKVACDQTGVTNEYVMGVQVRSSTNIVIRNMEITNAWFDGVYIQGIESRNVTVENLKIVQSGRNGLTLAGGTNITVRNVTISWVTNNTALVPAVAGMDIEPDVGSFVSGVLVDGLYVDHISAADGYGQGLYINARANNITVKNSRVLAAGLSGFAINTGITNVVVENCLSVSNGYKGFVLGGANITAINCQSVGNLDDGFDLSGYSLTLLGCVSSGNGANILTGNVLSGKLGIGRVNPFTTLEIASAGSDTPLSITVGSPTFTAAAFTVGASKNGSLLMESNGVLRVSLNTAGSSYLTGGNFGIGTTTPADPLHVIGNSRIVGDLMLGAATIGPGDGGGLALVQDGTSSSIQSDVYGVGTPYIISRRARGTKALPTATLNGDIFLSLQGRGYGTNAFGTWGAGITINATENWTEAAQGSGLRFYVMPNGTAGFPATEAVRVDHTGNVGIGTNAPFAKLHVLGNQVTSATNQAAAFNLGVNSINSWDDVTNYFTIAGGSGSGTSDFAALTNKPPPILLVSTNNGNSLTNLNASNLASGTVAEARSAHTMTNMFLDGSSVFRPDGAGDDITVTVGAGPVLNINSGSDPFSTAVSISGSGITAGAFTGTYFQGPASWTNLVNVPAGFADGTDDGSGGGSATNAVNVLKENGSQVGDSDITALDFLGADFDLTESPDQEVNIVIAAAIARDAEVAAAYQTIGALTNNESRAAVLNSNLTMIVTGIGITIPTNQNAMVLTNAEIATAGNPKNSPGLSFKSHGYNTTASADVPMSFTIFDEPTSTAGTPTHTLKFGQTVSNGLTQTFPMTLSGAGQLTTVLGITAGNTITAPTYVGIAGRAFMGSTVVGQIQLLSSDITTGALVGMAATISTNGVSTTGGYTNKTVSWLAGTGSPEGAVVAAIGSMWSRTDGTTSTATYRKETGTGNTGWVADAAGGGSGVLTMEGSATNLHGYSAGSEPNEVFSTETMNLYYNSGISSHKWNDGTLHDGSGAISVDHNLRYLDGDWLANDDFDVAGILTVDTANIDTMNITNFNVISDANIRTNIAQFDVSTSAFVVGTRYTNSTRRSFVTASFQLSAAAAGTAAVSLRCEQAGVTNRVNISAGPLASLATVEQLSLMVGPGAFYYFVDDTSGTGASVAIVSGTSSRTDW